MGGILQAIKNKQTTIFGSLILVGMGIKLFFPGSDPIVDQLVTDSQQAITNLIGLATGIGLLLAKDGATGSAP